MSIDSLFVDSPAGLVHALHDGPPVMQVSPDLRAFVRIRGEFSERPGVRLTSEQVQRVCGLDSGRCDRMLEALVQTRFLYRAASCYVRLTGYSPSQ